MRWFSLAVLAVCCSAAAYAHHPDREHHRVWPTIDLIGPLGNRLPISYRRRYNRPRYVGGKIAYCIAPSSQGAMAWHRAAHRGYYKDHSPRMVTHYFYPKPWEGLRIGPRPGDESEETPLPDEDLGQAELEREELLEPLPLSEPVPIAEPLVTEPVLIEP